jgi:hypothetical protein
VRRLAPPVGLGEPAADCQDDIGLGANLVDDLREDHRHRVVEALVDHVATGPARGHRGGQQLGDPLELRGGHRVQHAAAGVDGRRLGPGQHPCGLVHELRGRLDRQRAPVPGRRDIGLCGFGELAVHDVLGNREVHDAGAPAPRDAQRPPRELTDSVERGNRAAPLGHGS